MNVSWPIWKLSYFLCLAGSLSAVRISHVSRMNQSCYTFECVMSHPQTAVPMLGRDSRFALLRMNDSCHTYARVKSHTFDCVMSKTQAWIPMLSRAIRFTLRLVRQGYDKYPHDAAKYCSARHPIFAYAYIQNANISCACVMIMKLLLLLCRPSIFAIHMQTQAYLFRECHEDNDYNIFVSVCVCVCMYIYKYIHMYVIND